MFKIKSGCWFVVLVLAGVLSAAGNAQKKQTAPTAQAEVSSGPTLNARPIRNALALFGKLLQVIYSQGGAQIVIEIDPILNKTGVDKELPAEASQWVREAIAQIGYPLRSYEAIPTSLLVRPVFPGVGTSDRSTHPTPTYRVTGALERFFEREVKGKELELYVRAGGGGTSTDGNAKRTKRATVTRVTLSLTLEQPDGLDLATASYFVDILKTESDRSWGFFVGGTGVGGSRNILSAEDPGDAIFDAAAAALVTIISRAPQTLAPYYRCDTIFPEDETVNDLEHQLLNRMITGELLSKIKPFAYLSGATGMDMKTPEVTPSDRELIVKLMRNHHLDPANRDSYAQYLYELWHDVPIAEAADRLQKRIDEVIVLQKEMQAAELRRQSAEKAAAAEAKAREETLAHMDPPKFGWPNNAYILLIDLEKVNPSLRAKIFTAIRSCVAVREARLDGTGTVLAVRLRVVAGEKQASKAQAALEGAIHHAGLNADLQWARESTKHLYLSPK